MARSRRALIVRCSSRGAGSMTDCKSMIAAFKSGGCFHSRTAMGMFDHVKAAVERGDCLLEWDYAQGEPPAPLLKVDRLELLP